MREPSERADGLYDDLLLKLARTMELTPRERAALDFAAGGFLMCGRLHRAFDLPAVRGRCYLHGFNRLPGSLPELADVGVYEDRIVKVASEWRFASRTILMDGSRWTPPAMESAR